MHKSRRQAYLLLVGYLVRVTSGFKIYDLQWPTDCKVKGEANNSPQLLFLLL